MLKFITGNKNKFKEIQTILAPLRIEQINIDLSEIQELDPYKIIKHKLNEAFKHHKGEFIVEDDSVYLESLDHKLPGPFIKWFNQTIGNKGMVELAQRTKRDKVLLHVIIGYAKNPKKIIFFESKVTGRIVKPRGKGGFGFDPIFLPDNNKKTFAQLKAENNFNFNARGLVVKKLKAYLLKTNEKK